MLISDDEPDKLSQEAEKLIESETTEVCEEEVKLEPKLMRKKTNGKWSHDLFDEGRQIPKSNDELLHTYGYDIREDDGAPKARRRRRYGRGPNKYTRNWKDETAYGAGVAVPNVKPNDKKVKKDQPAGASRRKDSIKENTESVDPSIELLVTTGSTVKSESFVRPGPVHKDKEPAVKSDRPRFDRGRPDRNSNEENKFKVGKSKFDEESYVKRNSFSDRSKAKFDHQMAGPKLPKKEFDQKRREDNTKKRYPPTHNSNSLTRNNRSFDLDHRKDNRHERNDKDYRTDRFEKDYRADRVDKEHRTNPIDKPYRSERNEKDYRSERSERDSRSDRNDKDRERSYLKHRKSDDHFRSNDFNGPYGKDKSHDNAFNNKDDFPGLPTSENKEPVVVASEERKATPEESNCWNRPKGNVGKLATDTKRSFSGQGKEMECDDLALVFKTQTFENSRYNAGKRFGNLTTASSASGSSNNVGSAVAHPPPLSSATSHHHSESRNGMKKESTTGRSGPRNYVYQDNRPGQRNSYDHSGTRNGAVSKYPHSKPSTHHNQSHQEHRSSEDSHRSSIADKPEIETNDYNHRPSYGQLDNGESTKSKRYSSARQPTPRASSTSSQAETPTQSRPDRSSASPAISLSSAQSVSSSQPAAASSNSFTANTPKSDLIPSSQSSSARQTPATNNSDATADSIGPSAITTASNSTTIHSSAVVTPPIIFTTPNSTLNAPAHTTTLQTQSSASPHTNSTIASSITNAATATLLHGPAVPSVHPVPTIASHLPTVPLAQPPTAHLPTHHQMAQNAAVAAHHQSMARGPSVAAAYYDASRGQPYYPDPTRAGYAAYLAAGGAGTTTGPTTGTGDDPQMNRYLAQQLAANPYTAAQIAPTAQDQSYLQPYLHHAAHTHHSVAAAHHQAASYAGYHTAAAPTGYAAYAGSHQTYHPHPHHSQATAVAAAAVPGPVPGAPLAPTQPQEYSSGGVTYYNLNMQYMNNVGRQMSQRKRTPGTGGNTLPIITPDVMLQQQYN